MADSAGQGPSKGHRRMAWVRLSIGIVVVALVLWKILPSGGGSHVESRLIVAAVAVQPLILLSLLLNALRLGMLAGLPAPRRLSAPFSALLLSYGLNLLLPGRVAELFKTTYLHAHANVPVSQGMAALFLERSVDLLIVAGLSVISLLLLATSSTTLVWVAAGVLVLGLSLLPRVERWLAALVVKFPWPLAAKFATRFLQHVSGAIRQKVFFRALGLAMLAWLFSLLNVVLFLSLAETHPIDLKGMVAVFVATTIGGAIPALPGGFGAYEAAAILVLRPYGYSVGEAFALGVVLHLAQFVIPMFATGVILASNKTGVRQLLQKMRKELAA